ncbi:sigma factor [Leptolyngbya sp. 7M]|uniref:sigma factor n=1 Tax=Leptolyngbya sp. 7M TaxID=2812896 RepID=UPI001B8C5D07|nr:sigma factor [Leptolyngbya sp. 7M]QYO64948.1 hypothetical protein JVX88_36390 [Leptolyngbya sp. 7M]
MDATVLSNLQPALRQLVREEIWQAQSRPDVLQDLFLALLEHGDGITHPLAWAKRWLRNRRIDRWRRESSKAVQFQSLTTEHDAGSSDESPLDAMIDAESQQQAADNRRRLHDAIPRLPRCQREAMALEIDPARQSSAIEAKPPGKSHRSNVYKATKSLKTLLAGDEAQDVRVAAPEPGCATSRHRPARIRTGLYIAHGIHLDRVKHKVQPRVFSGFPTI